MKKKNVFVVGLSLLAIASLAACNTDTGSTATTNTGGDESSTSSTSQVGRRAEMTVEKTEIVAGQNFFDACKPTVIYYDENNEPFDYTTWVNYVRYTVTSEDGKTYTAGAGLALVGAGGNLTLLVVALWLRLCIFREKKRGIGSCQTGGKRVQ